MRKKTGQKKLESEDEWYSENEDYEEDYEDEGDYKSEVEEMDYERTDRYEQLLHDFEVESDCRLLWEGHNDIAQQWWEYENGKGAEMSLSQDEVYLVDDLRTIQSEESFSDITWMEWEPKKNVLWPLTPEEVIEASEEENDSKYEETSDDDESQIEVVINSGSTSLITPEEKTLTEEWKVNKSLANQVKQEDAMMNEFIKWPKDDQEETFEPQAIDIGTEGIGIEKDEQAINMDVPIYIPVFLFTKLTPRRRQKLVFAGKTQRFKNEFFLYDHPTLNDYIAAQELNLREAVYWVDFYSYPLIANDPNELLILQNQMQNEVRQSEARQLMTLQTGIDPGCDRRLVDDNSVLILPVEIELD
ncbi:8394_t:CDS:2 [Dentiscutata erythropus]|uniref:8394_t:CDS:1 n=1 Tax=Dentiscutata erythropus TaxID=1348616 RepID=A0A9N8W5R0_9GLOM|nr:8394_t:CDS:2 [Dentiscutata erythropus]